VNYRDFRRHLGKADLNINEFASLIEVQARSVSNYCKKGTVPRTYAVIAVLLGEAADRGVDFRELLARFGLQVRRGKPDSKVTHLDDFRKRPGGKI
jgi:hypothetical protein